MSFLKLFAVKKPVITVLHGRGSTDHEVLEIAKKELDVFMTHEVNAVMVENYFCTPEQAEMVLDYVSSFKGQYIYGVNLLGDAAASFKLSRKYNCDFMQLDSVSGHLTPEEDLEFGKFLAEERAKAAIPLIGGVRFKYQPYHSGRTLKEDMDIAVTRCDAIAVTGNLTGQETSLQKIREFRDLLPNTPLVIAAGVTPKNAKEQLALGDACIVGSYFKEQHHVEEEVKREYVEEFMAKIRQIRE